MKVGDIVREEAAKYGRTLTEGQIEYIVWEQTGYPSFWPDDTKTPEENFRMQLREYFAERKAKKMNRPRSDKSKSITIIRRYALNGTVKRVLSCGHEQSEPSGGKASKAAFVRFCHACAQVALDRPPEPGQPAPPPAEPDDQCFDETNIPA